MAKHTGNEDAKFQKWLDKAGGVRVTEAPGDDSWNTCAALTAADRIKTGTKPTK
jgi:hypothetical protein